MTSGIVEILQEAPTVQGLVGLNKAGTKYKVFPVVIPDSELSADGEANNTNYITVHKDLNDSVTSLTKDIVSLLDYPRITIAHWSKNFRPTEQMHEATRAVLDGNGFITEAGYKFSRIWLINDRDGYEEKSNMFVHVSTYGIELDHSYVIT